MMGGALLLSALFSFHGMESIAESADGQVGHQQIALECFQSCRRTATGF